MYISFYIYYILFSYSYISVIPYLLPFELILTAKQGNPFHPLQNERQHIPRHETMEGFLACSQESFPLFHILKQKYEYKK